MYGIGRHYRLLGTFFVEKERTGIHMKSTKTYKIVWSGVFIALGIVLPFLTGQIQSIGNKLLPMHLPILICGFVCGAPYGLTAGLIVPLLRSILFGMPPMFPTAVSMALELAVYGFVTGLLYKKLPKNNAMIYVALIGAMLIGRVAAGAVNVVLYGVQGSGYSMQMFMAGMFMNAVPGIILQLVLIPVIIMMLRKAKVME